MDSVQVVTHPTIAASPVFQSAKDTTGVLTLSWNAPLGQTYQLQYSTNRTFRLGEPGTLLTATNSTMDSFRRHDRPERFYRLLLPP